MRASVRLVFIGIALSAGCMRGGERRTTAGAAAGGAIAIGDEKLVSVDNPGWIHSEYMASLDPSNPERMVACSMPFDPEGNDIRTALYVTFDGGRSWAFSKDIYPAGDPA